MISYMTVDTDGELAASRDLSAYLERDRAHAHLARPKALGCSALRDGAYLLPAGPGRAEALRELGDECEREGGSAWLMTVTPDSADDDIAYRQLFDRAEQYAELRASWKNENRGVRALSMTELTRLKRRLEKEFEALRQATSSRPRRASRRKQRGSTSASASTPSSRPTSRTRQRAACRDSTWPVPRPTWATRRRLWVDWVASAWLIRRFIDPDAKLLARQAFGLPEERARLRLRRRHLHHVGDRVTFETLMASFGLDEDAALARLATIVHALDVGGEPVAEATGFEAVMAGAASGSLATTPSSPR